MDDYSADDLQQALAPMASLISKSEKAQQKLAPGSWQHTMLRDNLKALDIAQALMGEDAHAADNLGHEDLQGALHALASMIDRTQASQPKFSPGTPQHSLLANRLKALRIAQSLVRAELDRR